MSLDTRILRWAATGVLIGSILGACGGSTAGEPDGQPPTEGRGGDGLSPRTLEPADTVDDLCELPQGLAAGTDGTLWVACYVDQTLVNMTPDGTLVDVVPVGYCPEDLAVSGGDIWVLSTHAGKATVERVDLETRAITAVIDVGEALPESPGDLYIHDGDVWVTTAADGQLSQIDGATNDVVASHTVGDGASNMVAYEGSLWVNGGDANVVVRVDPASGDIQARTPVGSRPQGLVASAGAVWSASADDGTVTRIDPATSQPIDAVAVGDGAHAIVAEDDVLWVANYYDGTISRVDPASGAVIDAVRVGADPVEVLVAPSGDLWVVDYVADSLVRYTEWQD